ISERGLISAPQLPSHPPAGNKPEDQDRERIGGHTEKNGQQPDEEPVRSRGCGGRMGVRRVRGLEGRAADVSRAGGGGPSRGRRHGPLRRVVPSGGCRKRGLRRVRSRTDWSVGSWKDKRRSLYWCEEPESRHAESAASIASPPGDVTQTKQRSWSGHRG